MSAELTKKLRVGVLRGGPSTQYEASLKTGNNVIEALLGRHNYEIQDVFIDRSGVWHIGGVTRPFERIFPYVDVIVNALHGTYGEDGRVQQILESHNVPYTGSRSLASALGMNTHLSKKFFKMNGLLTPEHLLVKKDDYSPETIKKIISNFPHLRLVKPSISSSSLVASLVETQDELEIAMTRAFDHADSVMIEEYVRGKEVTCGVVESGLRDDLHFLQPVEIVDPTQPQINEESSDFASPDTELVSLIQRANLEPEEDRKIRESAVSAHRALGLRHYSQSEFVVNRIGVYILETNTLPRLTPTSLFPRALALSGLSLGDFLDHIIDLALNKKS